MSEQGFDFDAQNGIIFTEEQKTNLRKFMPTNTDRFGTGISTDEKFKKYMEKTMVVINERAAMWNAK